jgi:hypothetical protein
VWALAPSGHQGVWLAYLGRTVAGTARASALPVVPKVLQSCITSPVQPSAQLRTNCGPLHRGVVTKFGSFCTSHLLSAGHRHGFDGRSFERSISESCGRLGLYPVIGNVVPMAGCPGPQSGDVPDGRRNVPTGPWNRSLGDQPEINETTLRPGRWLCSTLARLADIHCQATSAVCFPRPSGSAGSREQLGQSELAVP